jgi:type IV pili sensor histidine kinase/response regulator
VPTDAQKDPLQEIVTIDFPEAVDTVGQAVNLVLADTGYTMADVLYWDVGIFALVQHSLPQVQRQLGPLTVLDLLQTLVGQAFKVVIDPVNRSVSFELEGQAGALGRDAAEAELPH